MRKKRHQMIVEDVKAKQINAFVVLNQSKIDV